MHGTVVLNDDFGCVLNLSIAAAERSSQSAGSAAL
jgi:hypothetical protein